MGSKSRRRPGTFAQTNDQSTVPMINEFDYKVWEIQFGEHAKVAEEISEYLNQRHLEGWVMPNLPAEVHHDKGITVSAVFIRQTKRNILEAAALA